MLTDLETQGSRRLCNTIEGMHVPTQYLKAYTQTAAASPQLLNLFIQPPQCQTSRRFMVSTGIPTYGSNGTGGVSGEFMVEMS